MKRAFISRLLPVAAVFVALGLATGRVLAAPGAPATAGQLIVSADGVPIEFWNREIAVLRSGSAGLNPQYRADQAVHRLHDLPLSVRARDLQLVPVTIMDQSGIAFSYEGRILFFLGNSDLDLTSGEKLDQVSERVLLNLDDALEARDSDRRWPVIRSWLFFTFIGLLLVILAWFLILKAYTWLTARLHARE